MKLKGKQSKKAPKRAVRLTDRELSRIHVGKKATSGLPLAGPADGQKLMALYGRTAPTVPEFVIGTSGGGQI
jgi:hypothetical protein